MDKCLLLLLKKTTGICGGACLLLDDNFVFASTRASLMNGGDGDTDGEPGSVFLAIGLYAVLIASFGIRLVGNAVGTVREKGPEVLTAEVTAVVNGPEVEILVFTG